MKISRTLLAAGLLALCAGVSRAADAKSSAPAADAKKDACPDLSGKFACPAVARYKQKAMTVTVKNDPAAKTFEFSYDDGSPAMKVAADGKRKPLGKEYSSYICRDQALIQLVFKDAKTKK